MQSSHAFDPYLATLERDRRALVEEVIALVDEAVPEGYEHAIEFGMPSWVVPLQVSGPTYNGRPLGIASIAAQKRYTALYLTGVYADEARVRTFEQAYRDAGVRLDMGRSCVRFTSMSGLVASAVHNALREVTPERLLAEHRASRA